MTQELTEDDLEVAEASVAFAMQNCPVEGILSTEDGSPISLDMLQALLERLRNAERDSTGSSAFAKDELLQLQVVVGYTYENCPIEGAATFHDGRTITGKDSETMVSKVRRLLAGGLPQVPQ